MLLAILVTSSYILNIVAPAAGGDMIVRCSYTSVSGGNMLYKR